jgi:hypothetical protein
LYIDLSFRLIISKICHLNKKKAQAAAENIAKRWKHHENIDKEQIEPISANDGCNKGCQTNSERFRSVQTQIYTKPSNKILSRVSLTRAYFIHYLVLKALQTFSIKKT